MEEGGGGGWLGRNRVEEGDSAKLDGGISG